MCLLVCIVENGPIARPSVLFCFVLDGPHSFVVLQTLGPFIVYILRL